MRDLFSVMPGLYDSRQLDGRLKMLIKLASFATAYSVVSSI